MKLGQRIKIENNETGEVIHISAAKNMYLVEFDDNLRWISPENIISKSREITNKRFMA